MIAFVPVPSSTTCWSILLIVAATPGERAWRRTLGGAALTEPFEYTWPRTSFGSTKTPPLAIVL